MSKHRRASFAVLVPTAHRQHGLYTGWQAHPLGITQSAIDRRIASGDVVTPAGAKRFFDAELESTGKTIQELGIQPE